VEYCVLKTIFDYSLICIVGFVVGVWIMIGAGFLGLTETSTVLAAKPTEEALASTTAENEAIGEKLPKKPKKINPSKTHDWVKNASPFVDELKYLEEANCSDHAMRQYASFIRNLDTSGFDKKSGRLISADGEVLTRMQWNFIRKTLVPLQPLTYMKDEHVPKSFKHVMKAIPRARSWKTCKFNIPITSMLPNF
jgi:hypothetical protein